MNEATARIKINTLLEAAAYRVPLLPLATQQAIVERLRPSGSLLLPTGS